MVALKATAHKQSSKQSKVTVQKSIAEFWTVISNQMIKYQLLHKQFDQVSDHKRDVWKAIHYVSY